jgi:hypothetical protein
MNADAFLSAPVIHSVGRLINGHKGGESGRTPGATKMAEQEK